MSSFLAKAWLGVGICAILLGQEGNADEITVDNTSTGEKGIISLFVNTKVKLDQTASIESAHILFVDNPGTDDDGLLGNANGRAETRSNTLSHVTTGTFRLESAGRQLKPGGKLLALGIVKVNGAVVKEGKKEVASR